MLDRAEEFAVLRTGAVTSVGLDSSSACAAIRAGLTNPSEIHILNSACEWFVGHRVPIQAPTGGIVQRLVQLATLAIEECLAGTDRTSWAQIPILLCTAEQGRPGRAPNLDAELFAGICQQLSCTFHKESVSIARGRSSAAVAMAQVRRLLARRIVDRALVVASDSLLDVLTLCELDAAGRVLTSRNSNGFIPGEAAAAALIGAAAPASTLRIAGLGFAREEARLGSDVPLRAEGLVRAMRLALDDAGCELHDMDFRITDLSGEQYYFKETALSVQRLLRRRKEEFDLWHPAEYVGEIGSAIGPLLLAVAHTASTKNYAPGRSILVHFSDDAGERAAAILRYR
jgi:3-oxoacyl-[acyl-carrier-protein] synthase-1